ncbi:B12-binding domain-containing radical SAM protein [Carboxydocella sp. ULO1]|uniref:B12-binding domain-containing radical SAM protein n=1 Tax=Carboxydocella sp. ULO1 TaxID=1926599 RepID=UPI0009AEDCEC|nr:radical SAM protein [Carboxydocella sp. ULO1]GAW28620.1 hypothetical protein ULO1_11900 [Carboxydocella sp. ULO1]
MIVFIEPVNKKIDTYTSAPPLAILELASWVKDRLGVEVRVVDVPVDYGFPVTSEGKEIVFSKLIEDLKVWSPMAVGISCTGVVLMENTRDMLRRIRQEFPDLFLFAGGYMPTLHYRELLYDWPVDLIVVGEGEEACTQIVQCLMAGEDPRKKSNVNLAWREGDKIVETKRAPFFDLNIKPYIDLSLLRHPEAYSLLSYISSRGCSYKCSYCVEEYIRPHRRLLKPDYVREEIRRLKEISGKNTLFLFDPLFGGTDREVFEFSSIFRELGLKFIFETRSDVLKASYVPMLKENGAIGFALGFESASFDTLRRMNKVKNKHHYDYYINNTRKLFLEATKNDLPIFLSMMMGYPGDTEEDLEITRKFIWELNEEAKALGNPGGYIFLTYDVRIPPNTKFYDQVKAMPPEEGVTFEDEGIYGYNQIVSASPGLHRDQIRKYAQEIFSYSKYTKTCKETLFKMAPFMRIPPQGVARLRELDDWYFYPGTNRQVFNIQEIIRRYSNFKTLVNKIHEESRAQFIYDSKDRQLYT